MGRHSTGFARKAALVAIATAALGSGCGDDIDTANEPSADGADALRLGRVHVVMEPSEGSTPDEQLEVTARFAFVRGLDEDFARARMNMPLLSHEVLRQNQCTAEDLGIGVDADPDYEPERELVLVDAGALRIHTGNTSVQVPLSLVPDLLPYMSGVEYVYYSDPMPSDDDSTVVVEADGSPSEELSSFVVETTLPSSPTLAFLDEDLDDLARDALVLHWSEDADAAVPLTLRFTPTYRGEPAGDDITCVFGDNGQVRVDMQVLHTLGLPSHADSLTVTASRASTTTFDAGAFTGSELVVERRSSITVPLP